MKNRKIYIDIMKILAMLAVICIHSSSGYVHMGKLFNTPLWWKCFAVYSCSRWAVPIFIMSSGALLLNSSKKDSLKVFFKKKLIKIVIPFIVASIFYYLYDINFNITKFSLLNLTKCFMNDSIFYHLWYMYIIIGIYLIVPILREYISSTNLNKILYLIILGFVGTSIYSLFSKFTNTQIAFSIPFVTGYIFIFMIGYYLDNIKIKRNGRILIYLLGIFGIIVTIQGTYNLSSNRGIDEYWLDCLSFSTVFVAIAVFVFIKYLFSNLKIKGTIVSYISNLTYWMYLVHAFVLILVGKLTQYLRLYTYSGMTLIIIIVLTFTFSIIVSSIIKLMSKTISLLYKMINTSKPHIVSQ